MLLPALHQHCVGIGPEFPSAEHLQGERAGFTEEWAGSTEEWAGSTEEWAGFTGVGGVYRSGWGLQEWVGFTGVGGVYRCTGLSTMTIHYYTLQPHSERDHTWR